MKIVDVKVNINGLKNSNSKPLGFRYEIHFCLPVYGKQKVCYKWHQGSALPISIEGSRSENGIVDYFFTFDYPYLKVIQRDVLLNALEEYLHKVYGCNFRLYPYTRSKPLTMQYDNLINSWVCPGDEDVYEVENKDSLLSLFKHSVRDYVNFMLFEVNNMYSNISSYLSTVDTKCSITKRVLRCDSFSFDINFSKSVNRVLICNGIIESVRNCRFGIIPEITCGGVSHEFIGMCTVRLI